MLKMTPSTPLSSTRTLPYNSSRVLGIRAPRTLTISGKLALGITTGVAVNLVIQPLTTLRTLRMNNKGLLSLFERNVLKTTKNYYRGLRTNILKIPPYITFTFFLNEALQVEKIENPFEANAKSAFAGAVPTIYSNIFDHVVTRQQLEGGSFISTVGKITKQGNGLRSLERGLPATMGRMSMYSIGVFSLPPLLTRRYKLLLPEGQYKQFCAEALGTLTAAVIASHLSTPFDHVRSRVQAGEFSGVANAVASIYQNNRGNIMKVTREVFRGASVRVVLVGTMITVSRIFKLTLQDRMPDICYK